MPRKAFIIGNSIYKDGVILINPQEDAQSIAKVLKELNFDTELHINIDGPELSRKFIGFSENLSSDDTVFFYFAGHAFSHESRYFLMGVDATLKSEYNATLYSLPLETIFGILSKIDPFTIIFVDACRNNPYNTKQTFNRPQLQEPALNKFSNLFVMYSASDGQFSIDNPEDNHSPFAFALLRGLTKPKLTLLELSNFIIREVKETTSSEQTPVFYTKGSGYEFIFNEPSNPQPINKQIQFSENTPIMIEVPKGKFYFGAPQSDKQATSYEKSSFKVTLDYRFAVSKFPITQGEWDFFISSTKKYSTSSNKNDENYSLYPVVNVSWYDAMEYVDWLSTISGKSYRLCSETEWEYCCRAGTESIYWYGDIDNKNDKESHFKNIIKTEFISRNLDKKILPVNHFKENKFGLSGMCGNIWEWVSDSWSESLNNTDNTGKPLKNDSYLKVVRGGDNLVDNLKFFFRCSARSRSEAKDKGDNIGFRIALRID
jgi:formylglycine-generating enzyme required for sulfatase activity